MTEAIKKKTLFLVSFVIFAGLRITYRFLEAGMKDTYGYFERAMIQAKEQRIPLTDSGVAYAYTGALSGLFRFVGNRIDAVWGYQIFLQGAAIGLLVLGCYLLFGKAAANLCMAVSVVFPYLIMSPVMISPENYFMFFFSLLFFMIGIFYAITAKSGWYRNNRGEIFLILIGFLSGMLCIWHGFGLVIPVIAFWAVFANKEKVKEQKKLQQNVWEMEKLLKGEAYFHDEKEEVMGSSTQLVILSAGMFLGGFCTLMKYTGVTGAYIREQFGWWTSRLVFAENGLWQEMNPLICIYLGGVILMSGLFGFFAKKKKKKAVAVTERREGAETAEEIKPADLPATDEEKKVVYLDNPLPVPKRHEKRTMDFALEGSNDEFDVLIDAEDDFDV